MTGQIPLITQTAGAAIGGLAFGFGYFALLRHSASLFVRPGGRIAALGFTVGRLAAAAVLLWLAAPLGAPPLLSALGGFLVARAIALREASRCNRR